MIIDSLKSLILTFHVCITPVIQIITSGSQKTKSMKFDIKIALLSYLLILLLIFLFYLSFEFSKEKVLFILLVMRGMLFHI